MLEIEKLNRIINEMVKHLRHRDRCPDAYNPSLQYSKNWTDKCYRCRRHLREDAGQCWIDYYRKQVERDFTKEQEK